MSRLYTFGCSCTNYIWPTWADILGKSYKQYENWGRSGAGNLFIYNSIIECLLKNKLSSSDRVFVMWSSTARNDYYYYNQWHTEGGLYLKDSLPDLKGFLIRDLSLIYGAEQALKRANVPYVFLSMVPINSAHEFENSSIDDVDDLLCLYQETISSIRPSIYEIVFNYDWYSRPKSKLNDTAMNDIKQKMTSMEKMKNLIRKYGLIDPHPLPNDYLEYLEKVAPEIIIDQSTKEWVHQITTKLLNSQEINWNQHPIDRI